MTSHFSFLSWAFPQLPQLKLLSTLAHSQPESVSSVPESFAVCHILKKRMIPGDFLSVIQ